MANRNASSSSGSSGGTNGGFGRSGNQGLLVGLLLAGVVSALFAASINHFLGAGVFLLFAGLAFWAAPTQLRKIYRFIWLALLIGLPLGTWLWAMVAPTLGEERHIAMQFAVIALLLGFGFVVGASVLALPLVGITLLASAWVLNVGGDLGLEAKEVKPIIFANLLGIDPPYMIVEEGRITHSSSASILGLGGPGILIVKPENGAVLEWGGEVSQVIGPGITRTRLFERVKTPLDLRPKWATIDEYEVSTKEGQPLYVKASFRYQLEADDDTQERYRLPEGNKQYELYPGRLEKASQYAKDTLFRAAYRAGMEDWGGATRQAVQDALSKAIAARGLSDLFGAPDDPLQVREPILRDIEMEARNQAWLQSCEWGVCVKTLTITNLTAPEAIRGRIMGVWQAQQQAGQIRDTGAAEAEVIEEKGKAEAQVLRVVESVKTAARAGTYEDILNFAEDAAQRLPDVDINRFLTLLEKLAFQMGRDRATAFRYIQAIETMSRNPDAKLIVAPGGSDMIIDTADAEPK